MPSSKRDAVAAGSGRSWIVQAWKWGAGSLSAGAALVSIISSVRSLPGDHVRWIGVRPTADTAWAIGDSIQLALTITDAHGGDRARRARRLDLDRHRGGRGGQRGHGRGPVAGGGDDRRGGGGPDRPVADPGPRRARPPSGFRATRCIRLGEGGVARLVARVVDARRHPVPGQPVTWRSSDPSVAVVDSAGRVTGVTAGRGMLAASGGELVLERPHRGRIRSRRRSPSSRATARARRPVSA